MSDDTTAISLPLEAEEGIIGPIAIPPPWLDGPSPQLKATAYVTGERMAALEIPHDGGRIHAYGVTHTDGITTRRDAAGKVARFVAGAWLEGDFDPEQTLLAQTCVRLSALGIGWDDIALKVDDRPILGAGPVGPALATADAANWSCSVTGELTLPGWRDLLLRPDTVSCATTSDGIRLRFDEGASVADGEGDGAAEDTLVISMARGTPVRYGASLERLAVSLVLDDAADGAWEQANELWVAAGEGWLRVPSGAGRARLGYSIGGESRICDIGRCFDGANGAGLGARLLLDRSGAKSLSIDIKNGQSSARLTVRSPAIVFLLRASAMDGASLRFPDRVPGQRERDRLSTLYLAPASLGGVASSIWTVSLAEGQPARLGGQLSSAAGGAPAPTFYSHYGNWVLPPEAAANDSDSLGTARVLIPLQANSDGFNCVIESGRIAAVHGFDSLAQTATRWGPLARFGSPDGVHLDEALCVERWPGHDENSASPGEPAVLRPLYRQLPAGLASTESAPAWSATRITLPLAGPQQAVPLVPGPVNGAAAHLLARAGRAPQPRVEPADAWPPGHFGWLGESMFASFGYVHPTGAPAGAPAWDWLEYRPVAGSVTAQLWLRLSDGSLLTRALEPAPSADEALERVRAGGVALDAALDPVDLLRAYADSGVAESGGLALLALEETINGTASQFTLTLRDGASLEERGPTTVASASRIVAAWAGRMAVTRTLDKGIVTRNLTRVFLELERDAGHARVVRGLIGWEADSAFGLVAAGAGDPVGKLLEVTEVFETVGQSGGAKAVERTLEFNGVLRSTGADLGARCELLVYCWDATLRPGGTTLPVICNYVLKDAGLANEQHISAVQDLRLVGEQLDFSADIAVFGTGNTGADGAAANPWEPDRRGLFSFKVSLHADSYKLKGFIKVRTRSTGGVRFKKIGTVMRLVPAWAMCDQDIAPRFSTLRNAQQRSHSWCRAGLLRTRAQQVANGQLDIHVYFMEDFFTEAPNYACTLIGESAGGAVPDGLPQWVPSPVRSPRLAASTPPECARYRLWIFNPHAYAIYAWDDPPLPAGLDDAAQRTVIQQQIEQARHGARGVLWKTGWSREAVLERRPAALETDQQTHWSVLDSPLQNRGASVAWAGWPMSEHDRHPTEDLPLTSQIAQRLLDEPDSFAVQVAFADADASTHKPLWPILYRESRRATTEPAAPAPELGMLTFRSAGVRVGAVHRLVHFGTDRRETLTKPPQPRLAASPSLRMHASERGHGAEIEWGRTAVSTGDIAAALDGNTLTLTLPGGVDQVRIQGLPAGTLLADGQALVPNAIVPLVTAPTLQLTIAAPQAIPYFTLQGHAGGNWSELSVFPSRSPCLGGIFDEAGRLLAFGEVSTAFTATAEDWVRFSHANVALHDKTPIREVTTIDLDGQVTRYTSAAAAPDDE